MGASVFLSFSRGTMGFLFCLGVGLRFLLFRLWRVLGLSCFDYDWDHVFSILRDLGLLVWSYVQTVFILFMGGPSFVWPPDLTGHVISDRTCELGSHGQSNHLTKHITNRMPGSTTARSLHDLVHTALCMDMHRSTLVYIYIYIYISIKENWSGPSARRKPFAFRLTA